MYGQTSSSSHYTVIKCSCLTELSCSRMQADKMSNDVLKQVFQAMHANIATSVNPDSAMDALFSKNVIGSDDYYRLRQIPGSRDRCREMLSLQHISKHPQAFVYLRLVLVDEYSWIVEEIDQRLLSLVSRKHQPNLVFSAYGKPLLSAYVP